MLAAFLVLRTAITSQFGEGEGSCCCVRYRSYNRVNISAWLS